jgi:hypothetical protein
MGRFRRSLLAALLWSFWSGTFIAAGSKHGGWAIDLFKPRHAGLSPQRRRSRKHIPGYGLQETLGIGPVACAIGLCIEYALQASYLLVTNNTGYIQHATCQ